MEPLTSISPASNVPTKQPPPPPTPPPPEEEGTTEISSEDEVSRRALAKALASDRRLVSRSTTPPRAMRGDISVSVHGGTAPWNDRAGLRDEGGNGEEEGEGGSEASEEEEWTQKHVDRDTQLRQVEPAEEAPEASDTMSEVVDGIGGIFGWITGESGLVL